LTRGRKPPSYGQKNNVIHSKNAPKTKEGYFMAADRKGGRRSKKNGLKGIGGRKIGQHEVKG